MLGLLLVSYYILIHLQMYVPRKVGTMLLGLVLAGHLELLKTEFVACLSSL